MSLILVKPTYLFNMNKNIAKIKKWIESEGYTLKVSNTDEVDYDKNQVTLCNSKNKTNMIYSLLHECGHIVTANKKSYGKKYRILNKANIDNRHTKGKLYVYKQLQEEVEAWERGYKLSKKLGILIDKDSYDKYAAKCFNTYIKYHG